MEEITEHKRFLDGVMLTDINNLKSLIENIGNDLKDINNKISNIQMKTYYLMGISTTIIITVEVVLRFFVK
jgi:S-adenosylmethionine/arginine decarboxylase-like enzyme